MKYTILTLIALFGFTSCVKEEVAIIDSRLTSYFDQFEVEAAIRGKVIDIGNLKLIATLDNSLPTGILGQCVHNSALPNEIKISLKTWQGYTEEKKEYIVFHELGHCVLNRSHNDEKNIQGTCASIMESGAGDCKMDYGSTTRKQLLDELFAQ